MPKLADLLNQSVNNSSDFDNAWYVRFAYNLHMDVLKAQRLFSEYGVGYIYARTGFVMPDTPHQRCKMVAHFGACVVVTSDGKMWLRTPEQIGAKNSKKTRLTNKRKHEMLEREKEFIRSEKESIRLFKDGQTIPSPKRGGGANSYSDLGKFINAKNKPLSMFEPKSVDKFRVINIHI